MSTIPVELIAPLFNPASFAEAGLIDEVMREVRAVLLDLEALRA
jgi:hypothetical protein